jgi:hypothetical protein
VAERTSLVALGTSCLRLALAVSRIGRRVIMFMLLTVALAVIWNLLGR